MPDKVPDLGRPRERRVLERARQVLGEMDLQPEEDGAVCKLVIEGSGMERQPGVAAGVLSALEGAGVTPTLISTSETKIGLVVAADDAQRALTALRGKYAL